MFQEKNMPFVNIIYGFYAKTLPISPPILDWFESTSYHIQLHNIIMLMFISNILFHKGFNLNRANINAL